MNRTKRGVVFFSIIAFIILIYFLKSILTPFLLAALFAYMGGPVVTKMKKAHIPRSLSAVVVLIGLFVIISLVFLLLIPLLVHQIQVFISYLPAIINWIEATVLPWFNQHFGHLVNLDLNSLPSLVSSAASGHLKQAGSVLQHVLKYASESGAVIFAMLFNLVLIPVVTFYLLRDWDKVVSGTHDLLPRNIEPTVARLVHDCNEVLGAFLRGQLLVMFCLGIIYTIGLSIIGIDMAMLIGMMAGLASIVPYLGFIVGIGIAIIASLVQFHDILHLVFVVIVFAIGQSLESMVLTPWLVGDRIGLHPVAVIFAIMAGGVLFGFVGVLLALPVAAVIMVVLRHARERYLASTFYDEENAGI